MNINSVIFCDRTLKYFCVNKLIYYATVSILIQNISLAEIL